LQSFSDHRTAMSMIVAGLMADAPVSIDDTACISKSFPGFMSVIKHLLV
jgi:5-enolpyruvylshikimate-3-phosphate synthase